MKRRKEQVGDSAIARALGWMLAGLMLFPAVSVHALPVTLNVEAVEIGEVMDMLSRRNRINILLSREVTGPVSVNLYDVDEAQAIRMIASAAGYVVEQRDGSYFILSREDSGKYDYSNLTQLRTFQIQYSDPVVIQEILQKHLSQYGKITALGARNLLVVEDQPVFLERIAKLLKDIDLKPRQILIEAQIMEVTLGDSEDFGIDWKVLFSGGKGVIGTTGLAPAVDGLFIDYVNKDVDFFLRALQQNDRLRTLSTPKILALEGKEARAVIGDRQGFKVTTTINQVTTESIEFLESGVILKVMPTVDDEGRILMDIHPEVSSGAIDQLGIPSQKTTEVSTQMLVNDGQTVFIGGLMKQNLIEGRRGVPFLSKIPFLGRAFSQNFSTNIKTETVVFITPYIVDGNQRVLSRMSEEGTGTIEQLQRTPPEPFDLP